MPKKPASPAAVCRNRNAGFRFDILERIECGILLTGSEVKSLRDRKASLEESYARFQGPELWLIGAHIHPYAQAGPRNHEPNRARKLLLHRRELDRLRLEIQQQGLTLVPVEAYFNDRGILKITLGLARGRKIADRRQKLREKDHKRDIDRAMHRRR